MARTAELGEFFVIQTCVRVLICMLARRAIVESLASRKESLIVYAASRKGEDIGVASTSSVQVKPVKLDVSNAQSRDELFKSIESLDVLINNAGAQSIGQKQTNEVYMNVLDVNYYSTLQVCFMSVWVPWLKMSRCVKLLFPNYAKVDVS